MEHWGTLSNDNNLFEERVEIQGLWYGRVFFETRRWFVGKKTFFQKILFICGSLLID